MSLSPTVIELTEYVPKTLPLGDLPEEKAVALRGRHGGQVSVERLWYPQHNWQLTSLGWVGYIPLGPDLHLALRPKTPLGNLFQMLEYAYRVDLHFGKELVAVGSLEEAYERLALVLSRRVLDRARKGFYRTYVSQDEHTSYVRGRMDMRRLAQAPWDARVHCQYQEHTADIEDNQILAWTLFTVARSGICTNHALPTVRQAYRQLAHLVSLEQVESECCLGRLYHRLNEDYRPLHALCRFFLENSGPTYQSGDSTMLPFLVDMSHLFEMFVAEWLKAHQPEGVRFEAHHRLTWDATHGLHSDIDLVLLDAVSGKPLCVLDTKYKVTDVPGDSDVHQVVFYAEATGCHEAVLIYPQPLAKQIDTWVGSIHVWTLYFALDEDLDKAGDGLLSAIQANLKR